MQGTDLVARFAALFESNKRSFGQWDPAGGRMRTIKSAYGLEHFEAHLSGQMGLGLVPIRDDGRAKWGAIDIDAHGDAPDIDIRALEAKARAEDLPLVICRSKSGGAHCYLFLSDPIDGAALRSLLAHYATVLGYPGVEIFPKQSRLLAGDDGELQLGNWLNLAYFAGDDTNRYAIEGGEIASLEFFIETAENRRVSPDAVGWVFMEHGEAPPCIQSMMLNGVGDGARNEALYNLTLYLKKAYPDDYRQRAMDLQQRIMDPPLDFPEAKRTIESSSRRDYHYKCNEEPIASLCDRATCLKRKFGVKDRGAGPEGSMPEFGVLRKFDSEPVYWELDVNGVPVRVSTEQLASPIKMKLRLMETLMVAMPRIKQERWDRIVAKLLQNSEIVEVPDEASVGGQTRERLFEYLRRAQSGEVIDENDAAGREPLLRGQPVMAIRDGRKVVYFKGQSFVDYLKKKKSEDLRGVNLWMALRQAGVSHTRLRVKGESEETQIKVWYVEWDDEDDAISQTPKNFDPGF